MKRQGFVALLFILVCGLSSVSLGKYSGGSGTAEFPYLIATPNDLNAIGADANDWDKHFKMIADINMAGVTGTQFNIIGNETDAFTGVFDGNGHSILNFSYRDTSKDYIGLFGRVDDPCAVIKNLRLINPNVDGHEIVGALVGGLNRGTLLTCFILGGSVKGWDEVGGMVSYVGRDASLIDCKITCDVSASNMHVGGLVSSNWGEIKYCAASCRVYDAYAHIGGLAYVNHGHIRYCFADGNCIGGSTVGGFVSNNESIIEDSYSKTNVSGSDVVGGFAKSAGVSRRCYSAGQVSTDGRAGGFAWITYNNIISSCFWDTDIATDVNDIWHGDDPNVTGLPTAQMQQRSTFTDAGWDMVNVWDIGENQTYPFLRTHLPSDINKDDETNFLDLAILVAHWLKEE